MGFCPWLKTHEYSFCIARDETGLLEAGSAKLKAVAFHSLWFLWLSLYFILFWSGAPLTSCYSKVCGRNTLTLSEALNWLAVSQAVTLRGGLGRNLVQHKCDFCLWVPRDHCLNTRTGESLTAFILIVGNFTCSQMMDFESGLIRNQSNDPWSVTTNSTENCCPKCWSHVSA